jgi:uncharacterized protein DUF6265
MHGGTLAKFRVCFNILVIMAVAQCAAISPPLTSRTISAQESAGTGAQSEFPSDPARTPAPVPAPTTVPPRKFTLADFAWLPGRWLGQWGPRIAEQVWTPARAGTMFGIFRVIENDKTLVIELLALNETSNGIEYRIRHFTPDLAPWEKSDSTVLNLASLDAKKIVFDNPVDGQPKHAILDRVDEDTYIWRSEIVPLQGDTQVVEITLRRQKPTPKKP